MLETFFAELIESKPNSDPMPVNDLTVASHVVYVCQ